MAKKIKNFEENGKLYCKKMTEIMGYDWACNQCGFCVHDSSKDGCIECGFEVEDGKSEICNTCLEGLRD